MSFTIVILLMVLPVLAICALAIYLGMGGIEDKRKARMRNRKSRENELIWNGLWKLVGADVATLDKAIRFLREDERARTRMSDKERMKKIALLRGYKSALEETREKRYATINGFGIWNKWNHPGYHVTLVTPLKEPQNSIFSDFEWIA